MKRHRGRKKKNRLSAVVLTAAVLILIALITFRYVLVVRNVELAGTIDAEAEEVIRNAGVKYGSSIFSVNEAEIRRQVEQGGTLVLDSIEKKLPNTLVLHIHVRQELAYAPHVGNMLVMDENACTIRVINASEAPELIYVRNFDINGYRVGAQISAQASQLAAYCSVMSAVKDAQAAGLIREMDLDDQSSIILTTRSGITVKLGNSDNMPNKIAWMKSAVIDLQSRGESGGVLDVSSGSKADYSK